MNYLGHAFLSMNDGNILTGNIIGDYVKGKSVLEKYPEEIRRGILLHRKIDSYTDAHPAVARAKILFREMYHLYAGAIVDILFDHFLANDPKYFSSEKALFNFSQQVYEQLEENSRYFPEKFVSFFPYMRSHNWLYGYRTLKGIGKSLKGLEHRSQHVPDIEDAYKIFVSNYYQLTQCYYEFIGDVFSYVKVELSEP